MAAAMSSILMLARVCRDQVMVIARINSNDSRFGQLREDPNCVVEENQLVCRLDPASRLTFLRQLVLSVKELRQVRLFGLALVFPLRPPRMSP